MRIVIVGCGRVGAELATTLSAEGHEVAVVDRNPLAFARLGRAFRGRAIEGVGFDRDVLVAAGIERADGFAAVTNGDNTNVVSALVARDVFRVPRVMARIADPRRAEIYRRYGVSTISPTTWGANEVRELLLHTGLASRLTLGSGEVEVVEVRVGPRLAGHPVARLTSPASLQVVGVVRGGAAFVPTPGTELQEGDLVYVAVAAVAMPVLDRMVFG